MDINLRFRHAQGADIGPFSLPDTLTVHELKDRLLLEWPKEGPLVKDMPNCLSEVTLILNGKVLENAAVLRGKGSEKGKKQGCGCSLQ